MQVDGGSEAWLRGLMEDRPDYRGPRPPLQVLQQVHGWKQARRLVFPGLVPVCSVLF